MKPRNNIQLILHLLATLLLISSVHARIWTSSDGTKTFEAKLESYDKESGLVKVRMSNGSRKKFNQNKLSVLDIKWLKKFGKLAAKTSPRTKEKSRNISILSYNVLAASLAGKDDGNGPAPEWKDRKERVYNVVKKFKPDFIGSQEMQRIQHEDFKKDLPQYTHIGNGWTADILYLHKRWKVLEEGTFPVDSGREKRFVRWAYFSDKFSGKTVYFYTLHFSHSGQSAAPSRLNSAKTLADHIANKRANTKAPVIVTGDFNSTVKTKAMRYLVGKYKTSPQKLIYANALRIDHVLLSKNHFKLLAKDSVPTWLSGSDHPAVYVKVEVDDW